MATKIRASQILKKYENLQEVLLDKDLAGLGDMYVNFVHSLALSQKLRKPAGTKVNNRILAEAVKKSGLRKMLPRRIDFPGAKTSRRVDSAITRRRVMKNR